MRWLSRVVAALSFRDGRERQLETQADAKQDVPAIDMQPTSPTEPACPTCGAAMFKRFNRQTSRMFWGCTHYPRCKGMREV